MPEGRDTEGQLERFSQAITPSRSMPRGIDTSDQMRVRRKDYQTHVGDMRAEVNSPPALLRRTELVEDQEDLMVELESTPMLSKAVESMEEH